MTIVADTGPLYALVDSSDAWHERVVAWWMTNRADIVVPVGVIPEVAYLLQARIGPEAELAFVQSLADGELEIEPLENEDLARIAHLMDQYADMRLGFVDASVIAAAERLETRDVLTTDRRHFSAVRPRHARSLVLSP
ncbi:MAG: PIN domain-containing protein [Gemmatimonadaceae bacterium]